VSEILVDASMACTPDIWELKLFLWTSANMPAWNEVLLEVNSRQLNLLELNSLELNSLELKPTKSSVPEVTDAGVLISASIVS
jgi:hypothetical protein